MNTGAPPHFDAVVVGSGFGGSVAAFRLAAAERTVCVLERGKLYPPGSFPRNPLRMQSNFWDPSKGYYGLYDLWRFRRLGGVVASGVGGGSLIYANVLLRKDERSFVNWPVTREQLEPHYDRVEDVLRPQRYPIEFAPYDATPKTAALRSAAGALRLEWFRPGLGVTFAVPGADPRPGDPIPEAEPNLHDRPRETCRLCAECCFGCNHGSKNSLDLNYLSAAKRLGAEIRPLCEVRELSPRPQGGYAVRYVEHEVYREGRPTATHDRNVLPLRTVTADQLLLAAGTFGSTFLLLRCRAALNGLSDALGTAFSVNGDFVAVSTRCTVPAVRGRRPRIVEADFGTAITSAVRVPVRDGRESYVEDMGYPHFLSWMLQLLDVENAVEVLRRLIPRLLWERCCRRHDQLDSLVAGLFGSSGLSAGTLPMIGVGEDTPDGELYLRDGELAAVWSRSGSKEYYERALGYARSLAHALGGRYLDTDFAGMDATVTMHPLGGCPMGRSVADGVVDPYGEVFHHPGLFVADGSVMPGPVGVNPSLTIAAMADRTADRMLEQAA